MRRWESSRTKPYALSLLLQWVSLLRICLDVPQRVWCPVTSSECWCPWDEQWARPGYIPWPPSSVPLNQNFSVKPSSCLAEVTQLTHPQLGTWLTVQACALNGNLTSDPLVHRPALNPLSHTSQGGFEHFLHWNWLDVVWQNSEEAHPGPPCGLKPGCKY